MTRQKIEKFIIPIVALSTMTETLRLLWRLPYRSIGYEIAHIQLMLLIVLLLRATFFRFSSMRGLDSKGAWRRWQTFYYVALLCLIVNSFWNLCLFL